MRKYSNTSKNAALASWAAWEQGKFWEMHDMLFERAPRLERDKLDEIAREIGLDLKKFQAAMESEKNLKELQDNLDKVHELDIWSTPTTIINGTIIKGSQPYDNYKKVIDAELGSSGISESLKRFLAGLLELVSPAEAAADGVFGEGQVPLYIKVPPAKPVNDLAVGEEAPDFTLPSIQGNSVTLSDYRGKKNVLLTFMPAAFTPV
jgi:hypothetical protein